MEDFGLLCPRPLAVYIERGEYVGIPILALNWFALAFWFPFGSSRAPRLDIAESGVTAGKRTLAWDEIAGINRYMDDYQVVPKQGKPLRIPAAQCSLELESLWIAKSREHGFLYDPLGRNLTATLPASQPTNL